MALRRIPKDVEDMFGKYTTSFTRRLKKDAALTMLEKEFSLSEEEADIIFGVFDKDQNGELSLWEFNQFYNTIGGDAHKYLELFKEMHVVQEDESIVADMGKLWDVVKTMKDGEGNNLTDDEVNFFIMSTAGKEKQINLPKFINLMCRIKFHKGGKK